jgi:hypothetical protein
VTPAEIIYQRRVHVIDRAATVGVARACREAGVSRTSYYRWCDAASRYGLSTLVPKQRRRPQLRTQTPAHEEEIIHHHDQPEVSLARRSRGEGGARAAPTRGPDVGRLRQASCRASSPTGTRDGAPLLFVISWGRVGY